MLPALQNLSLTTSGRLPSGPLKKAIEDFITTQQLYGHPVTVHYEDIKPSGLPPLPAIKSQRILEQIFTHHSLVRRPKHAFEDSPNHANRNNEQ